MYMTMQPAIGNVRSGYAARRKSPIGIGGAIAVHAVVIGAFLLMPKEVIDIIRPSPPIDTYPVPLPPPPDPVVDQQEPTKPIPTQPKPKQPTAPDSQVDLTRDTTLTGGTDTGIDGGTGHDPVILPPPPLPEPVLVEATITPNARAGFQPEYPGAMIRQGMEGNVTVRITIGADGRVTDIAKISATDESFWLATQRHALRKWRFRPATRDGVAVASSKTLTVRFTLTDR